MVVVFGSQGKPCPALFPVACYMVVLVSVYFIVACVCPFVWCALAFFRLFLNCFSCSFISHFAGMINLT